MPNMTRSKPWPTESWQGEMPIPHRGRAVDTVGAGPCRSARVIGGCCGTQTAKASYHESIRLDRRHEHAKARQVSRHQLVSLQYCAAQSRILADLAGQEMAWHAQHQGHPGRPQPHRGKDAQPKGLRRTSRRKDPDHHPKSRSELPSSTASMHSGRPRTFARPDRSGKM